MKKASILLGLFVLALSFAGPAMACDYGQAQQIIVPQAQVQYQVVQPHVQRVIVQPQYQVQRVVVQQQVQRVIAQPHVQQVVVQRQVVAQPQVNVNVNRGILGLRQNVNVRVR